MLFDQEILEGIARQIRMQKHPLVTIDGSCASGKTTLASELAAQVSASVVHTDDYVIPHVQKTAERLTIPGGNCDAERLLHEVVIPWTEHQPIRMRRYDCKADILLPEEILPENEALILEGSYSNLPGIREKADVRIFLDVSRDLQEARLRKRESPESLRRFYDRWIPLEAAYFTAYGLPDTKCIRIDGGAAERL